MEQFPILQAKKVFIMEQSPDNLPIINKRLVEVRAALGLNQTAFASIVGISRPYLSNIEKGRRDVPFEVVTLLVEAKNLSAYWMHTGKGSMFLERSAENRTISEPVASDSDANSVPKNVHLNVHLMGENKTKRTNFRGHEPKTPVSPAWSQSPRILVTTVDAAGRDNISLVSQPVAAGYAHGGFIQPDFIRQLPTFSLPGTAYRNGTFRAFQVSGDSMQPTLQSGDWVICRFVDNWAREVADNAVHVVVTTDIPVVKRLLNRLNERGHLTLLSDNPAYPAQSLDAEEIREVWLAVAYLSRDFTNPRFDLVDAVSRTRADLDDVMSRLAALEAQNRVRTVQTP